MLLSVIITQYLSKLDNQVTGCPVVLRVIISCKLKLHESKSLMDHFPCQINAFDVELHHKFKAASADFLTT